MHTEQAALQHQLFMMFATQRLTNHLSLVKQLCYSHESGLSSPAVRYGRDNEQNALKKYKVLCSAAHDDVFEEAGLLVCSQHVFLAATPDMLIECRCCGKGLVEVKCPWTVRDGKLRDLLQVKGFLVESEGSLRLHRNHRYYCQIQTQLCGSASTVILFCGQARKLVSRGYKQTTPFWHSFLELQKHFFAKSFYQSLLAAGLPEAQKTKLQMQVNLMQP